MLARVEETFQVKSREEIMAVIHTLLEGLIDYAGLFPPAALDMKTAVGDYAEYRTGDNASLLGRFIVPAQRLSEFTATLAEVCPDEQSSPWQLSVLCSGNIAEDTDIIAEFNGGAAFLGAMELKAADVAQAEQLLHFTTPDMAIYLEFAPELHERILRLLKKHDARAKIRTGGLSAEAIPDSNVLAQFLMACAKAEVPFKATAGLHHPLRSMQRLSYEEDSPSAIMHGFVNVFVAAIVAYQGAPAEDVINVLDEKTPKAFQWEANALTWRSHSITIKQIRAARENFAISFGSCSFIEPINELKAFGWL